MESDVKEVDKKLYRVVRKKGSHVSTKINPDGTKVALQFTDDNNDLTGPVDLIEVDESEYIRTGDVHDDISEYDCSCSERSNRAIFRHWFSTFECMDGRKSCSSG